MTCSTNTSFQNDLTDVIKLFFSQDEESISLRHEENLRGNELEEKIVFQGECFIEQYQISPDCNAIQNKRLRKRYAKLAVFRALSRVTKKKLPWGALTGIRPTKLYYQLVEEGGEIYANRFMREAFEVSQQKFDLLKDVVRAQKNYITVPARSVDIYIGIPFCSTRCSYCSFVSCELSKCPPQLVNDYFSALEREILAAKQLTEEKGYTVNCVYVGGGTPTSVDEKYLNHILSLCDMGQSEFTVEAGRADTITKRKLQIIANAGAGRISINPQSLNDRTLGAIGRKHTVKQFFDCYELARQFPFKINVDLIAALPGENAQDFMRSLRGVCDLSPENITVHTLALKKGSVLKEQNYISQGHDAEKAVALAYGYLKQNAYVPYYMYRQKYMADNLENTGYARDENILRYNIDIMEETCSVIACGANAVTKRIYPEGGRIERSGNPKDIKTYVGSVDRIVLKKAALFSDAT